MELSLPKKVTFYVLLLLPVFLLTVFVVSLGYRIVKINFLDQRDIAKTVQEIINRDRREKDLLKLQSIQDEFVIYVFGGSSVVLPDSCDGQDPKAVFSELLAERLQQVHGKTVKAVNLGHCGMDSGDVLRTMARALEIKKPDLVVVYSGHNDYNNVYHHPYFIKTLSITNYQAIVNVLSALHLHELIFFGQENPEWALQWFFRTRVEPPLQDLLQGLRFVSYKQKHFDEIDRIILSRYKQNIDAILRLAAEDAIPAILLTVISNLEARPTGIDPMARRLYSDGMKETAYRARIGLLTEAKDREYFSPDIRAKTPLNDFIRGLDKDDPCVLDLEKKFQSQKVRFGQKEFLDYFHFTEETHRRIADLLAETVKRCQV